MARLGGGGLLIIFGVISGFLPVLQGWMFIVAGLTLMAPESRHAREALAWAKAKIRRDGEHGDSGAADNGAADGSEADGRQTDEGQTERGNGK